MSRASITHLPSTSVSLDTREYDPPLKKVDDVTILYMCRLILNVIPYFACCVQAIVCETEGAVKLSEATCAGLLL